MALNEKQEKFAQAYVLHRNATEAAKAAGYSDKSAYNQGYRLLQLDEVVERVHTLENELENVVVDVILRCVVVVDVVTCATVLPF